MAGNSNSGRRKVPTALKLLRGNPGKRRLEPELEPAPAPVTASFDEPPAELAGDARARAEWRRVAPVLRLCGLISEAERSALVSLCFEWSAYLAARAKLRKDGAVKVRDGVARVSPYIDVADRALGHCHRLWSELGLTPSGRAKVARLPAARAPASSASTPVSKWGGML
jgi:P27 family predicted phage terminase small subunit